MQEILSVVAHWRARSAYSKSCSLRECGFDPLRRQELENQSSVRFLRAPDGQKMAAPFRPTNRQLTFAARQSGAFLGSPGAIRRAIHRCRSDFRAWPEASSVQPSKVRPREFHRREYFRLTRARMSDPFHPPTLRYSGNWTLIDSN
jgi:hypothetical protein